MQNFQTKKVAHELCEFLCEVYLFYLVIALLYTVCFKKLELPTQLQIGVLFIDSFKQSLKAVLLYNRNLFPSIIVAYAVQEKDQDSVKTMLELIQYSNHNWEICGDFEMIALLVGLQGKYIKYSCFLCLWKSSANKQHYLVKEFQVSSRPNTHLSPKRAKFCFRHYIPNLDWQNSF